LVLLYEFITMYGHLYVKKKNSITLQLQKRG